jgi:hypothetical protein
VLSRIPYLGRWFKTVGYGRETQDLFLLVTVRLVHSDPADEVTHRAATQLPDDDETCVDVNQELRPLPNNTAASRQEVQHSEGFLREKERANRVNALFREYDQLMKEGKFAQAHNVALELSEWGFYLEPVCMFYLPRPRLGAVTYPVADLVVPINTHSSPLLKSSRTDSEPGQELLMHCITSSIAPQSWSDAGGKGTLEYFPLTMTLVVGQQTEDVHEEIAEWLATLRRLQEQEPAGDVHPPSSNVLVPDRPAVVWHPFDFSVPDVDGCPAAVAALFLPTPFRPCLAVSTGLALPLPEVRPLNGDSESGHRQRPGRGGCRRPGGNDPAPPPDRAGPDQDFLS